MKMDIVEGETLFVPHLFPTISVATLAFDHSCLEMTVSVIALAIFLFFGIMSTLT